MLERNLPPLHPGLMVMENLEAMDMNIPKAANVLSTTKQHLYRLVKGNSPITPDMAYRIGTLLGNGTGFWLRLQAQYDSWHIEQEYLTDTGKKDIADNILSHI